ncbi:YolD-like family protein [Neobacillus pocheonensis]|uniref:YolD-like family protein n=1 Tax=Neobacillus pocheonensis TaxID=363869 RepID=A0ABT0WFC9_9BACI|nr:YolD-like family protein [Neobacillus pocheonensis]
MANRDRGVKKWQFAFGMPEQLKMMREYWKDQERQPKSLIDVYEFEEFDHRICYVMEYHLAVKITIWDDGFTEDMTGSFISLIQFRISFASRYNLENSNVWLLRM